MRPQSGGVQGWRSTKQPGVAKGKKSDGRNKWRLINKFHASKFDQPRHWTRTDQRVAEALHVAPVLRWGTPGSRHLPDHEPDLSLQELKDSLCSLLATEVDDDDDDGGWGSRGGNVGGWVCGWGSRRRIPTDATSQLPVGHFPIATYSQTTTRSGDALDFLLSRHWSFCEKSDWKYFPSAWHGEVQYAHPPEPKIFIGHDLAKALLRCRLVCRHFRSAMMHMFTEWFWRWGGQPNTKEERYNYLTANWDACQGITLSLRRWNVSGTTAAYYAYMKYTVKRLLAEPNLIAQYEADPIRRSQRVTPWNYNAIHERHLDEHEERSAHLVKVRIQYEKVSKRHIEGDQ